MSLTPIADFVREYAAADVSRLHMPGHKGRGPLGCEALDLTEIAGADELYEAGGIIAASEENTARLFGASATCYGTEGSSQCIRAMLFLALQAAPAGQGRPVLLAARNAHKALLYAAALLDVDVEWLWPDPDGQGSLCACPVAPAQLAAALDRLAAAGRRPFAVYLTSPDYLGGMQDVAALAPLCHARGVPLLVDNAHGAYLHFLPGGSRHPIALGADLCCDSAHKTLPVLTGGAYLQVGRGLLAPDPAAVRAAMCLFGSTSPSYLILQSLDLCAAALAGDWPDRLAACIGAVDRLKRDLDALCSGLVRPSEPLKAVLDAGALGCTGQALADPVSRLDDLQGDAGGQAEAVDGEHVARQVRLLSGQLAVLLGAGQGPAQAEVDHIVTRLHKGAEVVGVLPHVDGGGAGQDFPVVVGLVDLLHVDVHVVLVVPVL